MKKVVKIFLFVSLCAVAATAGYGVISHNGGQDRHQSVSLNELGKIVSVSDADAHVGGQCYLDDTRISLVEGGCYKKCQIAYSNATERSACEVGCSIAISVATK